MRKLVTSCAVVLMGCGGSASSYVHSTDTTLGRVVVYRNGVAYFERTAQVDGDHLSLAVPADKIDDFLKSLTVTDARTGEPAPIAYPTKPPASATGLVDMRIGLSGAAPHQLRLSYVTEAPSWKPSYRVVLGKGGKVDLQAWAIVDNTSGEDWKGVKLGVGSSSAMSFRFDLQSVRNVTRETLEADSLFAAAPPMGGAAFNDQRVAVAEATASTESATADAMLDNDDRVRAARAPGKRSPAAMGAPAAQAAPSPPAAHAKAGAYPNQNAPTVPKSEAGAHDTDPIGTSHFESTTVTDLARGASAMVSIVHASTDGEVVYLYDSESARGNAAFPFRAIRIWNPTDGVLESGPVSVFGDGRFVGEGLCEPIPAKSTAFVPFALDRQIVAEHAETERDEIARILAVQRGVFATEVKHTKRTTVTLHNRSAEKATVYVRHTVAAGYTLSKTPGPTERVGAAHLVRAIVEPNATTDVSLEEETSLFKTTDVRSPQGLDLVKLFLSTAAEGPIKTQVAELVALSKEMASIEQQIATLHEQMGEYRQRMDELHAQIVTLRAVRTAGPLMQSLEKKLSEMSDKVSKGTIDVVGLEEKRMVARIHFEDGVADLTMDRSERAGEPNLKPEKSASKAK